MSEAPGPEPAKGGNAENKDAAINRGLSFKGKAAILSSVGKILAMVADALMVAAIICCMVEFGGSFAMIYFTPLLFAILLLVLMIMAVIGKPDMFLRFFMFMCTDLGILIVLVAMSFVSFPWGYANIDVKSFPLWASVVTWIVCVYLIILSVLHCVKIL